MADINLNILVVVDQDEIWDACGCIMGPERCGLPAQIGQAAFRLIGLAAARAGFRPSTSNSARLETTATFTGPADRECEVVEAIDGNQLLHDQGLMVLVSSEETLCQ